jgi:hypothetical protein
MRKLLLISMLALLAMSTTTFAGTPSSNTPADDPPNWFPGINVPPPPPPPTFVITGDKPPPNCEVGDECFTIPPIIAAIGAADATILLYEILRTERSRFPPVSP